MPGSRRVLDGGRTGEPDVFAVLADADGLPARCRQLRGRRLKSGPDDVVDVAFDTALEPVAEAPDLGTADAPREGIEAIVGKRPVVESGRADEECLVADMIELARQYGRCG